MGGSDDAPAPSPAQASCSVTAIPHACSALPAEAFLKPGFVNAGWDGSNKTRAEQATLATVLTNFILVALKGSSYPVRLYSFYHIYRELSGNGAGVYYDNTKNSMISRLRPHVRDIANRVCKGNLEAKDCEYGKGRRYERAIGAFRTLNALESSIFYSCNDPWGFCVPGFQPTWGFQESWFGYNM